MRKVKNSAIIKRSKSGYSLGKEKVLQDLKKKATLVPVVEAPKVPIPEGISVALTLMGELNKDISQITTQPYAVSIEVEKGEWILIVRGYEPPFSYYSGYKVKYKPSNSVKSPSFNMK